MRLVNGEADWFYEAERNKAQSSQPWTSSDYFLPGGFGFRTTNSGSTTIRMPGIWFDWCRQSTGYRACHTRLDLFTLAMFTALYPTLHVAVRKFKRVARRRRGHCLSCAYDLEGNESGTCPECGEKT